MGITLTLIISMSAFLLGGIIRKYYMGKGSGSTSAVFIFNAVGSVVSALVLFFWGGFSSVSLFTLIMGVLFGIVVAVQAITNLKALELGPMSYTQTIISCSTLISALSGAMFFGEKLAWAHIVGMALMLISFALAVDSKGEKKKATFRWLIFCLAAFLTNGAIGIMQKTHQSSTYKGEINEFLVISFVISFIFSIAVALFARKGEKDGAERSGGKKLLLLLAVLMIVNGACVAVNHKLNLYLSGVMDSAVFFPIVNGGGLVTTTLAAVILFREKLTLKQWIGVVFGIASVIFLCNPF